MVEVLHISETEVIELLVKEYPQFRNAHLTLVKRFVDSGGRSSNTFLMTSELIGFEKFVAKGMILFRERGLENEWYALKLAQMHLPTPKLLVPDHVPQTFLLLSYIDGVSADEVLIQGRAEKEVFESIGHETGKLHTLQVGHFGNLLSDEKRSWQDYLLEKIPERVNGMSGIVSDDVIAGSLKLFHSLFSTIEEESLQPPILMHQDIYLNNFLFEKEKEGTVLIDYGMARGGRPFYDLAKFFILDLYHKPERRDMFLKTYREHISLNGNFENLMKLYLLKEAAGMVNFFHSIEKEDSKDHAVKILHELIADKGRIIDLIKV